MTKRFTVIDHNEWSEGDIIYYDDGEEMGWMDVCDKLNELHEENEERKRAMRIAEYYNKQLEDENKKLKKYIDSISKGG